MDRTSMIECYFQTWLKQDRSELDLLFSEDVIYSECYGPEYHGLLQVKQWFDDWNTHGRVLQWQVKGHYQDGDTNIAEWYFMCEYDNNVDGFDGVSIIKFDGDGKIKSIAEFQSKAEHYYPYG